MTEVLDFNRAASRPKIRVLVAVPCQATVPFQFVGDLVRMMALTQLERPDVELRLLMHAGTILLNQRNELAKKAIDLECTHVLWLDSDMRFPRDLLMRLLAHQEPIVAANYVTRRHPLRPVSVVRSESGRRDLYTTPDDKGLVDVEYTGAGVMLVDVDVYRNIPFPWYNFWYNERAGQHVGEDVFFCFAAREHGLKVLIDQDVSQAVRHIGQQEYAHSDAAAVRDAILAVAQDELAK